MDRFDRVFCWFMSLLAISMCGLLLFRMHTVKDILLIVSVCIVMVRYTWVEIPKKSRERNLLASICGNQNGEFFCVLERGHPGNQHKWFHSNGSSVGWIG
jgi:hypothetical protein